MGHVDAFSRAPIDKPMDTETEVLERRLEVLLSEEENMIAMQRTDTRLMEIMEILS